MEIELQPAGRLRDESGTSLIAPATVINYGLSEDWEAVIEGQGQTPLSSMGPMSLTAAGAFLKHVLVPGSLQNKDRSECCHRIWRSSSGQHRHFRSGRKPGRHHLAAVGLGHNSPQRRDRAHPRSPW